MNNGKIWLVVNPTVGVPIFLGAVAVGSFAVHVAVLTNTSWVSDFLSGRGLGSTAALESSVNTADAGTKAYKQQAEMSIGEVGPNMVVVLPDGRKARLVIEAPSESSQAATTAQVDRSLLTQ